MAKVVLLCGKICSGKSTYASELNKNNEYVILSSDDLMLPLSNYLCGDYDEALAVFVDYFKCKACEIVRAGANVIFDFGSWSKVSREEMKSYFAEQGIKTEMHYIKASDEIWHKRIEKRNCEVKLGLTKAYYVDEGLKAKAEGIFEEPEQNEVDILIEYN